LPAPATVALAHCISFSSPPLPPGPRILLLTPYLYRNPRHNHWAQDVKPPPHPREEEEEEEEEERLYLQLETRERVQGGGVLNHCSFSSSPTGDYDLGVDSEEEKGMRERALELREDR
jgi:hypothetical protein